jgi:putative ABC transport system permease protein
MLLLALVNDLKFAIRQLLKNPGFTAVAVLTLALGIGANTAIFSVVNAVLLRPAPYPNPDRLVWIWENRLSKNIPINPASPGNLQDWRDQSQTFERLSAWDGHNFNLTDHGAPERVLGAKVFADFFEVLGARPALGRSFLPEDDRAGSQPVALLSHGLWQRRFGGDTNILGKALTIDGKSFTVIGVMSPQHAVPFNLFDLWTPFALEADRMKAHGDRFLRPIGRLKPGVTVQQAQAELAAITRRLEQLYPQENTGIGVSVIPFNEMFSGEIRLPLLVLLGAVGFVLLIACANVANLLLARSAAREKEIALRAALGATRLRLTRQLFMETLLLCALGAAAGLGLAVYGVEVLRAFVPAVSSNYKVPIPGLDHMGIDRWVLLFTLGLSFVTALLCGLAPAVKTSKVDLNDSLKEGSRGAGGGVCGGRLRSLLVVSEVALTLVLLIGAGLMTESFWRLRDVHLGFDPRNVLTMSLSLPASKYSEEQQRADFYEQLVQRVQALPGVKAVAVANYVPLSGHWGTVGFRIEGRPALAPGDYLSAEARTVSAGYFRAMAIPVLEGRGFTAADRLKAPQVVMINQTMARRFWSNEDPIGQRLNLGSTNVDVWEIVGVVGDVRHFGPDAEARAEIFFPHGQVPLNWMSLIVRTMGDPQNLVAAVRAEVQAIDPAQPVYDIQTMEKLVAQSIAPRRFAMFLLGIFAGVALLLGTIGIYGVISYVVSKRTHEIGIRMALGARHRDVLRMVIQQGMKLALLGIGLGLAGAVALTRMLQALLFEVKPFEPQTFLLTTFILISVAFLACWLPARRAARVAPMDALRYE